MSNKFNSYLAAHNLDIYDVAKLLRDESPSADYRQRSRNFYVSMLRLVQMTGWGTVGYGKKTYIGVYDPAGEGEGVVTAYRVAEVLGCKVEEIA